MSISYRTNVFNATTSGTTQAIASEPPQIMKWGGIQARAELVISPAEKMPSGLDKLQRDYIGRGFGFTESWCSGLFIFQPRGS